MSETVFQVGSQNYSREQLWAALTSSSKVVDVTVTVKEARFPVKFEGHEKFLSARRNYDAAWALVESIPDWSQRIAARQMLMQSVQKDLLETEDWLGQCIGFMWAKDNLRPHWRNPENPAVKAGWDIQAFLRGGGTTVESNVEQK
jgi:hypothetical protein